MEAGVSPAFASHDLGRYEHFGLDLGLDVIDHDGLDDLEAKLGGVGPGFQRHRRKLEKRVRVDLVEVRRREVMELQGIAGIDP